MEEVSPETLKGTSTIVYMHRTRIDNINIFLKRVHLQPDPPSVWRVIHCRGVTEIIGRTIRVLGGSRVQQQ